MFLGTFGASIHVLCLGKRRCFGTKSELKVLKHCYDQHLKKTKHRLF